MGERQWQLANTKQLLHPNLSILTTRLRENWCLIMSAELMDSSNPRDTAKTSKTQVEDGALQAD